ncbi:MAG: GntR family transcriptional regulator [Chloroflexota bacterium]
MDSRFSQSHLTSAEKVILALRTAITSGALPAGMQIRQEEIAAQYDVSRMPVREALRQLEAEGLIVIYPGRGAFVNRLSADEIQEIYDIRILLESDALRRAVPVLTPAILAEAETLLSQLAEARDGGEFGRIDEAFHAKLYIPAQRPRLLELINTLRNQVTQFLYAAAPMKAYRDGAMEEHRQILDACHAGDVEGAVTSIKRHLSNSVGVVIASNSSM